MCTVLSGWSCRSSEHQVVWELLTDGASQSLLDPTSVNFQIHMQHTWKQKLWLLQICSLVSNLGQLYGSSLLTCQLLFQLVKPVQFLHGLDIECDRRWLTVVVESHLECLVVSCKWSMPQTIVHTVSIQRLNNVQSSCLTNGERYLEMSLDDDWSDRKSTRLNSSH